MRDRKDILLTQNDLRKHQLGTTTRKIIDGLRIPSKIWFLGLHSKGKLDMKQYCGKIPRIFFLEEYRT